MSLKTSLSLFILASTQGWGGDRGRHPVHTRIGIVSPVFATRSVVQTQ